MRASSLYPYFASFTTRGATSSYRRSGAGWQGALRAALERHGYTLGDDGTLAYRGAPIGVYRTLEIDEVRGALGAAPWLDVPVECPSLGEAIGFFNWNYRFDGPWSPGDGRLDLADALAVEGRGVLARATDHRFARALRKRTYRLSDLLSRHGFDGGAAFLRRDPEHLDEVFRRLRDALARAGLIGELCFVDSAKNPVRLARREAPPLFRLGNVAFRWGPRLRPALFRDAGGQLELVSDPERALSPLKIELWAPDLSFREWLFW